MKEYYPYEVADLIVESLGSMGIREILEELAPFTVIPDPAPRVTGTVIGKWKAVPIPEEEWNNE